MATIRQDEIGLYVICNGHKVRPTPGGESKSELHMVSYDGERWGKKAIVRSKGWSDFVKGQKVAVRLVSQSPLVVVSDAQNDKSELWFANERVE